jgi:hypothetical protein
MPNVNIMQREKKVNFKMIRYADTFQSFNNVAAANFSLVSSIRQSKAMTQKYSSLAFDDNAL